MGESKEHTTSKDYQVLQEELTQAQDVIQELREELADARDLKEAQLSTEILQSAQRIKKEIVEQALRDAEAIKKEADSEAKEHSTAIIMSAENYKRDLLKDVKDEVVEYQALAESYKKEYNEVHQQYLDLRERINQPMERDFLPTEEVGRVDHIGQDYVNPSPDPLPPVPRGNAQSEAVDETAPLTEPVEKDVATREVVETQAVTQPVASSHLESTKQPTSQVESVTPTQPIAPAPQVKAEESKGTVESTPTTSEGISDAELFQAVADDNFLNFEVEKEVEEDVDTNTSEFDNGLEEIILDL